MGPNRSEMGPNRSEMGPNKSEMEPNRSWMGPNRLGMGPMRSGLGPMRSGMGPVHNLTKNGHKIRSFDVFPSARTPFYTGDLWLSTITIDGHSPDITES